MIRPTTFLDDEKGAVDRYRLFLVGGLLLIAAALSYDLFGNQMAERFTADDPGVEAFSAKLSMMREDATSR